MSPRIPGDGDRWYELAQEMGEKIGHLVREVVPGDAAAHLLNAQRELLTALVLIYEHQAGARRDGHQPGRRTRRGATSRSRRVNRIRVD